MKRARSVLAGLKRRSVAILRAIFWPKTEKEKRAAALRAHELLNVEFTSASNACEPSVSAGSNFGKGSPVHGSRMLKPRAGFSQRDVVDEVAELAERHGWLVERYAESSGWRAGPVRIASGWFDLGCVASWSDPEREDVWIRFEATRGDKIPRLDG